MSRASGRLAVALLEARKHPSMPWALEASLGPALAMLAAGRRAAAGLGGRATGMLEEYWIAGNPQRALGRAAPRDGVRTASVEQGEDSW